MGFAKNGHGQSMDSKLFLKETVEIKTVYYVTINQLFMKYINSLKLCVDNDFYLDNYIRKGGQYHQKPKNQDDGLWHSF